MMTFADLGIPFPLFEAPTSAACDYIGRASCHLCGGSDRHCFDLGHHHIIVPCPACGAENEIAVDGRRMDAPCESCDANIPFPESLKALKQVLACYDCIRAGRVAMIKSTEFGLVAWNNVVEGVTGGPMPPTDQFERVLVDPEAGDWYGARVPREHLQELLRTPEFHTWQGEEWPFCCRRPMTYRGEWPEVKALVRPADPRAFFESLFEPNDEMRLCDYKQFEWGSPCLYIYRCRACGRHRTTMDAD